MDINEILTQWYEAKEKKKYYEKRCNTYKKIIEKHMDKKNKSTIIGKKYKVSRRSVTREQVSKQNIPVSIWKQYANKFTYNSYYIKLKTK